VRGAKGRHCALIERTLRPDRPLFIINCGDALRFCF